MKQSSSKNDLYSGLEDILPTKKELSWETRSANPVYRENLKKGKEKLKDDLEHQSRLLSAADKKRNDPNWKLSLQKGINARFAKQNGLIYTPYGVFNTLTEASNVLNIDGRTILKRIKEKVDYLYIPFDFDISKIDLLIEEKRKTLKPKIKKSKCGQGMSKPIQTPFGLFITLGVCYNYIKENNIMKDPSRKIPKLIKTNPKDYYHITQKEYIMLTGREI